MHDRPARPTAFCWNQNCPRVCGEKFTTVSALVNWWGSPPHMRGKVAKASNGNCGHGITPPYAGKRHPGCRDIRRGWDHPRICGEKQRTLAVDNEPQGSPPHMRGKGKAAGLVREADRITPAYAGKRSSTFRRCRRTRDITPAYAGKRLQRSCRTLPHWDHPRICGEKFCSVCFADASVGSPPHMRGKAHRFFR